MREFDHTQANIRGRSELGIRRTAVRLLVVLVLAMAIASSLLLVGGHAKRADAQDATLLLPDLRMGPIQDLKIRDAPDGRRLLRFSTIIVNVGAGPLEMSGQRSPGDETMSVTQVIYDKAGGLHRVPTSASMFFSGDGHDHWHVRGLQRYTLKHVGGSQQVREGAKEGFCVYDAVFYNLTLPRAPEKRHYTKGTTCGEADEQDTVQVDMGLSVGWADHYAYLLPYQWIDITGLRSGTYRLRVAADVRRHFKESREANNYTWAKIELKGEKAKVLKEGPVPRYCGRGQWC